VLRDLDLLAPLAAQRLVRVFVSVTTLDASLARRLEPRAPTPERRVQVLAALSAAGVPVGVLPSPMIPGLNDTELEALLEAGARAGATSAGYQLLRLPGELGELFTEWLEARYPEKAARVLSLVRQTRGGRLSQSAFGLRMRGTGPHAELLARRFEVACRRLGLATEPEPLDATKFRPPPRQARQTRLFG